jgi:hypothetical protein
MIRSRDLIHRRLVRALRPIETSMVWPRRLDNQPARAWPRGAIAKVVADLWTRSLLRFTNSVALRFPTKVRSLSSTLKNALVQVRHRRGRRKRVPDHMQGAADRPIERARYKIVISA